MSKITSRGSRKLANSELSNSELDSSDSESEDPERNSSLEAYSLTDANGTAATAIEAENLSPAEANRASFDLASQARILPLLSSSTSGDLNTSDKDSSRTISADTNNFAPKSPLSLKGSGPEPNTSPFDWLRNQNFVEAIAVFGANDDGATALEKLRSQVRPLYFGICGPRNHRHLP